MANQALQVQVSAAPLLPNGRGPPQVALADPLRGPTCRIHPDRELIEKEVARGYTHCAGYREWQDGLRSVFSPTADASKLNKKKRKATAVEKRSKAIHDEFERKKAINAARRKQKKERKEQERREGRKEGTGGILK
jgi:hypothetical protein